MKKDLNELLGVEFFENRYFGALGVINMKEVGLSVGGINYNQDDQTKIKRFIEKHPNFYYARPYEGYITYFFMEKPTIIPLINISSGHRGGSAEVKINNDQYVILLDLD